MRTKLAKTSCVLSFIPVSPCPYIRKDGFPQQSSKSLSIPGHTSSSPYWWELRWTIHRASFISRWELSFTMSMHSRTSSRLTSTWRNPLSTLQRSQSEMEHFLLDKSFSLCQRWGSWNSRYCILFLCLFQLSVLATYPQIIGYDQDVYNYFKQQLVVDLRLLASSHEFLSERTCVVLTWTLHIPRMGWSRTHHWFFRLSDP